MSEKTFTKKTFEIFEKIVSQCQNILLRCPSTSWRISQNTLSKSENVVSCQVLTKKTKWTKMVSQILRLCPDVKISCRDVLLFKVNRVTRIVWAGTTFSDSLINNQARACTAHKWKTQQSQIIANTKLKMEPIFTGPTKSNRQWHCTSGNCIVDTISLSKAKILSGDNWQKKW